MSNGLPFPISDNRSFAQDARFQQADPQPYYPTPDPTHYRAPQLKLPDYRHYPPLPNRALLQPEADHYNAVYDPSRSHVQGTYVMPPMHHHHYPSQPLLPENEDIHYPPALTRDHHFSDHRSSPSPPGSVHSPPRPHPNSLPGQSNPPPSPRAPAKRREKPKIELAPDQPLTTQGKPRTRVYVACVQCRSRKIRCDGAKPTCHNCNRRAANGGLPDCSYDVAPKRRGPDRHPGARQRASMVGGVEPARGRKRRRRNPDTEERVLPSTMNVNPFDNLLPGDGRDQKPVRMGTSSVGIPPAAQSHIATRPQGLSLVVEDLDLYRGREHDHPYSAESSHLSPLTHMPPPSIDGHRQTPIDSLPSQEITQYSPIPPFAYKSTASDLSYIGYSTTPFNTLNDHYAEECERDKIEIGAEPSLQFSRDTWWDALIYLYSSHSDPRQPRDTLISPAMRGASSQQIMNDIQFLFRASNFWFSFFNISRFFSRLSNPTNRRGLQPSLVLAGLAVANFIRSSEQENGAKGRAWAMRLRDEAQGALEASLNTRWLDETLVQSSWLIAFFEISAHPEHSTARVRSAFSMLDSLIRTLSLTKLDQDDSCVSTFTTSLVPLVESSQPPPQHQPTLLDHQHNWDSVSLPPAIPPGSTEAIGKPTACTCLTYTLGHNSQRAQDVTPLWLTTPTWKDGLSDAEVRKEECRRVVWSSMMLSAGHSLYASACSGFSQMDLYISDPANYAILFPGEQLMPPLEAKDTVWALYMRAMLVWHSCVRMRWSQNHTEAEKAQYAVGAWLEVDKIEEALLRHSCNIERAFLFQGREYIFNARMCISHEFQRYIPQASANMNLLFHREKAEEWLTHQASVAKQVMFGLQTITGQPHVNIGRRSFFVFWFMSQISRALTLWSCDHSLTIALDMSKTLLGPTEYLMSLWPCPEQRRRYRDLHETLTNACFAAGIPAPAPPQIAHPLLR